MESRRADESQVAQVRSFSQFYAQRVGVLGDTSLERPLTLTLARVLQDLAGRDSATAADIARDLSLDPGYLSRLLSRLERQHLIARAPSPDDGRQMLITLTESGRERFEHFDQLAREGIKGLLAPLGNDERSRLVGAMATIEELIGGPRSPARPPGLVTLRAHLPGDMGWVVQAHGEVYAREFGWTSEFEALVAEIVASFLRSAWADRERCWIAERDGDRVGSVFIVRESDEVAKLRLLLVLPDARGAGLGSALVREVVRFAREHGYRRLTLWTTDALVAARAIYVREGFRLTSSAPTHSFGHDLVEQTWDLDL